MNYKFTHIILLMATFTSCDFINPKEQLPTYIQVDDYEVIKGDEVLTNNVIDLWIGTAATDLGVFELPAIVPVLEDGSVIITMSAGVELNGMSSNKTKYFFYQQNRDTFNLISGNSFKYTQKTSYIKEAIFSKEGSENFENAVLNLKSLDNNKIEVETENILSKSNKIGVLYGEINKKEKIEMLSTDHFLIDNDKITAPAYLEFDYKTNMEMEVGMYVTFNGFTEDASLLTLYSSENKWKHVYIDIWSSNSSVKLNLTSKETLFKLYFRGEELNAKIALDNVKIVHQ